MCVSNSHHLPHDSLKPMVIAFCVHFRPQRGVAQWSLWVTLFEQPCTSNVTYTIWCNTKRRLYAGPDKNKRWGAVGLAVSSSMSMSLTLRPQNKDNNLIDSEKHVPHASLLFRVLIITLPSGHVWNRTAGLCWVIKVAHTGTDRLNYQCNSTLIITQPQSYVCASAETIHPFLICKQPHEAKSQQLL